MWLTNKIAIQTNPSSNNAAQDSFKILTVESPNDDPAGGEPRAYAGGIPKMRGCGSPGASPLEALFGQATAFGLPLQIFLNRTGVTIQFPCLFVNRDHRQSGDLKP